MSSVNEEEGGTLQLACDKCRLQTCRLALGLAKLELRLANLAPQLAKLALWFAKIALRLDCLG